MFRSRRLSRHGPRGGHESYESHGRAQIKALALSIEAGQVHTKYDVIGMPYGADPRLCDIAKQRRKIGLESLSKILDASKDVRAMNVHFATLKPHLCDLNTEGKTSEVSVITAWTAWPLYHSGPSLWLVA